MMLPRPSPRAWVWLLGGYAYAATVAGSTFVLARGRAAEGLPPQVGTALLWQALNWGLWIPVGWALWRLFRRRGLNPGSFLTFVLGGAVAVPSLALASSVLAAVFSPYASMAEATERAAANIPVALLTYTALAAVGLAAAAQRRADEAARLAADLTAALETARAAAAPGPARPEPERLLVSAGSRRVLVEPAEVEWFGSAGNYVVVNWNGREGLMRETLQALEKRLDPAVFARSHRSTIVNLAKVRETSSLSDGSWRLVTESGAELVASRTYRDEILRRLGRG